MKTTVHYRSGTRSSVRDKAVAVISFRIVAQIAELSVPRTGEQLVEVKESSSVLASRSSTSVTSNAREVFLSVM